MTTFTWTSAADWDAAQSEEGIVHENTAGTDHTDDTAFKKGYPIASPYPSNGLVSYFPLHQASGTDHSGNGHNGTVTNGIVANNSILGTTGIHFDGSSGGVDLPDSAVPSAEPMSVFGWFTSTNTDTFRYLVDLRGQVKILVGHGAETDKLSLYTGSWHHPTGTVTDGNWHSFTFTGDSGGSKLYIDGTLEIDVTDAPTGSISSTPSIGAKYNSTTAAVWDGDAAHVSIYNRVLSAAEIQDMHDVVAGTSTHTTSKKIA